MIIALVFPRGSFSGRPLAVCMLFFCLSMSVCAQDLVAPVAQEEPKNSQTTAGDESLANQEPGNVSNFEIVEPPPITRIVMFNSGLAQLVHAGTIKGNERIDMKFTSHDVDDVLKSLVFQDRGGGIVSSVQYKPSPDLQDIAAQNLGPAMTMAQTLQKYRGESVTIQLGDAQIQGSILSVENRQIGNDFVETVSLIKPDGIASVALTDINRIQFDDQKLRHELESAMLGLTKSRAANLKTLSLFFEGEGERAIRFSYNVDAPVWRLTYRLDLLQDKSRLQGWAHIDNVTGVAWDSIDLDLRSGRPQSFHVALFAPVLAERQSLSLRIFDIPADLTLIPQWFGFDTPSRQVRLSGGIGGGFGRGGRGGGGGGGFGFGGGSDDSMSADDTNPLDINSAVEPAAEVMRATKMVRFKIKDPVTLDAGHSAMVPVISVEIPVEQFTLLDAADEDNPARLYAQITNTSSLPLIPGPVSLYQDGDFVGDGVMVRIEQGEINGFVYGTDIPVSLSEQPASVKEVTTRVRRKEDTIVLNYDVVQKRTYDIKNRDALPRAILLEVPVDAKDVSPKPDRIAGDLLQYKIACKPNSIVRHEVTQTTPKSKELSLHVVNQKVIDTWTKDGADIQAGLLNTFAQIFALNLELSNRKSERSDAENRVSAIRGEQERLTGIIKVLAPNDAAAKKYLEKLDETESELEAARKVLAAAESKVHLVEQELSAL